MKKVGILTFHSSNNYGCCLQAYALQKSINSLGAECEIIRFQGEKLSLDLTENRSVKKRIIDCITRAGATVVKTVANPAFESFRKEHFRYSEEVTKETIGKLNDRYDLFVSGSDQVWNCNIAGNLDVYLQKFVDDPKKKGSYAASFGMSSVPDHRRAEYADLLKDFAFLGVREPEGAQIVKELTGRDTQVVLDPTQLLTVEEWDTVMKPVGPKTPYIFVYQLGFSVGVLKCAKELSKKTGLRLVFVPFPEIELIKGRYYPAISPAQWLYLIRNAEYVVTNSFHGTVFSVGFRKKFYTEISPNLSALGSRISSLLKRYRLEDRMIGENQAAYDSEIDYDSIAALYQQDRETSLEYLRNMLEG